MQASIRPLTRGFRSELRAGTVGSWGDDVLDLSRIKGRTAFKEIPKISLISASQTALLLTDDYDDAP